MLVYLDQNYASRLAKFLLGQRGQEVFGDLYRAMRARDVLAPPSHFHVLELRGGYLLPTFQGLFAEFAGGWWVRHWQEVVRVQAARGGVEREDLLTRSGSWEEAADLRPLLGLTELRPGEDFFSCAWAFQDELAARLELRRSLGSSLPFIRLLARLLAFRAVEPDRLARDSDLPDLVMAATIAPYADVLATDRYVSETLRRVGFGGAVYSGRAQDVRRLIGALGAARS